MGEQRRLWEPQGGAWASLGGQGDLPRGRGIKSGDLRDETNQEEARKVFQTDKPPKAKRREGIFPLEQRFSNLSVYEMLMAPTTGMSLVNADRSLEAGMRCCISNTPS